MEMTLPIAFLPQGPELYVLLVVVLLLFGGAKIPQLMRGIGRGVGELQEGLKESKNKLDQAFTESETSEPHKPQA
ncbi:MAG: twin-arginine translocase TatA/TatE family subunit [Fimbriimonadaceae bacterium]|nr:twin-arginine translocase TatA/TatE family subunit [Fimbriimonadaceae bacterium]QYK55459.1 MAG: twin-arginine translocase TatA/TatE family subunit [Fimbriimonadaceae bacterium]